MWIRGDAQYGKSRSLTIKNGVVRAVDRFLAFTKVVVVPVCMDTMLCESAGRAADFLAVGTWPARHGG